jgi:putative heme-binding domain-containing protein
MRLLVTVCTLLATLELLSVSIDRARAAEATVLPRRQTQPPGPPLSPAEAIRRMTVPEGFTVELVAAEPDIVNPVAMTFDERGRIWVTESFEYPRRSPGPGRDRIKILEDTDADGRVDKVTIFAEGLNIPSGIAVGAGGVWVANSPDLLFMQDTDGDGRADRSEVVVTGFGRDDTHELPNSLTWGPDGWLYGINGVFNPSHIEYRGRVFDFTCALFRIHPRTRDFELFAEGTSNPWGVAWDTEGSAFVSACVIDHLWHLTESGYYHRQGGPYPPFTWKIGSIVKHKHQLAAYCGIHYYDSDAYPAQYRQKLYMGNIHGNCINCDVLARAGSTYSARPDPDFLSANNAWFMPVAQKTGPDGCLYVLDWYDQYHCYQDANRDPQGVDRLKGRLYRIRYRNTPRAGSFDLTKESDDQLIDRLQSGNGYYRDIAQRLLGERAAPATRPKLEQVILDDRQSRRTRMHALWALVGRGPLEVEFHLKLLGHADPTFRAWGVRVAGNQRKVDDRIRAVVIKSAGDPSPDVQLQVAIAARKIQGIDPLPLLLEVASAAGDDELIPHIVWQNLHPLLPQVGGQFVALLGKHQPGRQPAVAALVPRAVEKLLAADQPDTQVIAGLLETLIAQSDTAQLAADCLRIVARAVQSRQLAGASRGELAATLDPTLSKVLSSGGAQSPLSIDAALLAASWKNPLGVDAARKLVADRRLPEDRRIQALEALIAAGDAAALNDARTILEVRGESTDLRRRTLAALGPLEDPQVGSVVLAAYAQLGAELQPQAIELLIQRTMWSKPLLAAIAAQRIPSAMLNVNQLRRLQATKDPEILRQVAAIWGSVRTDRNPAREQVVADMRQLVLGNSGDAKAGRVVFQKLCGQCHKIHGEGQDVGPDITVNGRSSIEQLLSNVFDPSLVIGGAYQPRTVVTTDGRVLTGLLAEDSPQRVVLKMQGAKLETIARQDIEQIEVSQLSLMPEGVEKQLKPQELVDLFAFITLDKPPEDPKARRIPAAGVPAAK